MNPENDLETENPKLKFQIVVFPGFDELDAIGPYEVLKHAANFGARFEVALVGLDGAKTVLAANGLKVHVPGRLDLDSPPEVVVIPGGGWMSRSEKGTWGEVQRGNLPRALQQLHAQGKTIASVCTGAMVLAAAGLLAGRRANTHASSREELRNMGVQIATARVIDEGNILTAGGVTSGIDLGLVLVARFASEALAVKVAGHIEYPWTPARG